MYKHIFKRLFDLTLSLIFFVLLSIVLIPVVLGLLLTGEHYVFYQQKRVGYKNNRFKILKFATMLKASPSLGTGSLTVKNDPRILPLGAFLRKTKINELPQIINVVKGDMSFVGPRPQMEVDFYKFPEHIQKVIYDSPPGITGIGSIIFRDEEKWLSNVDGDIHEFYKNHIAPYKGELELWYQKHLTLGTDMMLIFLTAWVLFFPGSNLIFRIFKDLPKMPDELKH